MTVSEYVHRGRTLRAVPGSGEMIQGLLWHAAEDAVTGQRLGDDYALCGLCGALVDVGGELRAHANEHLADRYDL